MSRSFLLVSLWACGGSKATIPGGGMGDGLAMGSGDAYPAMENLSCDITPTMMMVQRVPYRNYICGDYAKSLGLGSGMTASACARLGGTMPDTATCSITVPFSAIADKQFVFCKGTGSPAAQSTVTIQQATTPSGSSPPPDGGIQATGPIYFFEWEVSGLEDCTSHRKGHDVVDGVGFCIRYDSTVKDQINHLHATMWNRIAGATTVLPWTCLESPQDRRP
jgi:hypothetical protein